MFSAVHDLVIDGRELRVFANGSGRPILFLHDLGASAAAFDGLTTSIVEGNRELVAVDLPGSGHSDPVAGSDVAAIRDHLIQALPQLCQEPLDVVGHGFGGYLALSIAAARPAQVGHLIVADPIIPPRSGPAASSRMPASMAVSGALTTLRRGKLKQNLQGLSRARGILDQLAQSDPVWWEQLSRIAGPTLVLGCADRDRGDRALLDLLASAIPGAVRNTTAGGTRPHASNPGDFAGHILDFLAS